MYNVTIKIHHLPTNKEYVGDTEECNDETCKEYNKLLSQIGALTYLMIKINSNKVYFPSGVLKDCVVTMVKEVP